MIFIMKWIVKKRKSKEHPKEYEIRQRSMFLWVPKKIDEEVRWLEWVTIEEIFYYDASYIPGRESTPVTGWWCAKRFITK